MINYRSKKSVHPVRDFHQYAYFFSIVLILLFSCNASQKPDLPITGTWQLMMAITVTNGDSVITDYTKEASMIKVINNTHFAFLRHELHVPTDSSNHFDAGGGRYTLQGDQYTEHLDYYGDRAWEGQTFHFTITIHQDTLIQKGIEKVEQAGVNREIIEHYVRVR